MYGDFQSQVAAQLEAIRAAGTFKRERVIVSPQDARPGGRVWSASRRPGASLRSGTGHPADLEFLRFDQQTGVKR